MTEWYCYKDKVQMLDTKITLSYMQMVQEVPGIQCPKCGAAYLSEKVVRTVVRAAEELIEEK
ncbi:MAG: YgiT-type zinc finger protein [Acidobacteria bacterium]|nr:YgiT-type zinc finger protein [Acidobacteriota bacterium]